MAGPRRINSVTVVLLLGVAGGAYWIWKFFPIYWDAWQVDRALADGAARTYKIARLREPARSDGKAEIERSTVEAVRALGIDDPELALTVEIGEQTAVVSCDYTVEIRHPLIDQRTARHLHRSASTSLARIEW